MTAMRSDCTPDPFTVTVSSRIRSTSTFTKSKMSVSQSLIVFVCEQSRDDCPGNGIVHANVSDPVIGPIERVLSVGSHPLHWALLTSASAQLRLPVCSVPNSPSNPDAL